MADTDPLMPDPSLLVGEDRDKNVAEWLVGQIFGAGGPGQPGAAAAPAPASPSGEFDALARGLFAEYFGVTEPEPKGSPTGGARAPSERDHT